MQIDRHLERDRHSALQPEVFERRAEDDGRAVEAQNADAKRQRLSDGAKNSEQRQRRWDEAVRRARLEDAARENRELCRLTKFSSGYRHSALQLAVFERRAEEEGPAVQAQNGDAKRQRLVEGAGNSGQRLAAQPTGGPV